MELLPFQMPPFARIQYANKPIKDKWEPLVEKANSAYYQLERETVKHGLRSCTTMHISPRNMVRTMSELAGQGLYFLPLQQVGEYSGFAHSHPPVMNGRPWNWYGVLSNSIEDAYAFEQASNKELNHDILGKLLGYPDCCREFFLREWGAGYIDPVWQEAQNCDPSHIKKKSEHHIRLNDKTPWETNVMLRYIGIRAVPHIPCSHDCPHTLAIADSWLQLGKDLKIEGIDVLEELLQHPIEWDCLKGTAVVSTPLFKVETNSMTCYPKYVVQKEGSRFPEEAPKGLKFPWNESWKFEGITTACRSAN